jgi:IS5 family transposase
VAQLGRFLPLVRQGIQQAHQRVLNGRPMPSAHTVLSLFEPHTRVVKRGKIAAAVEFGRQVVIDEVEGSVVTRFHVLPAVEHRMAVFGRPPWLVTGDRKLHTKVLEDQAHALGVTRVVIPRIGRLSATQRARERQRAWKRRYRWRAVVHTV